MIRRIAPIFVIYLCTAATWIALGTTVDNRTHEYDKKLRGAVGELWGTKQKQEAPTALARAVSKEKQQKPQKQEPSVGCKADGPGVPVSLQASNLAVDLSLEPRQKGLLWYSTYRVKFGGRYEITNPTEAPKCTTFEFKFPSEKAIYDNVTVSCGRETDYGSSHPQRQIDQGAIVGSGPDRVRGSRLCNKRHG